MKRKLSSKHEDQIEHVSEDCESFEWGLDDDCTCGGLTIREKREKKIIKKLKN